MIDFGTDKKFEIHVVKPSESAVEERGTSSPY